MLKLALSSLACLAVLPGSALAQPAQTDEERRLQEIEQQLQQNQADASAIRRDVPQKEQELSGLRTRLIETAASLKEAEFRLTTIEQRLVSLEAEVTETTADLSEQRGAISDILAALQSLEMSRPPALVVSPEDAAEAARAAMALSATVPDLQARVDLLQETVSRLDSLQTTMSREKEALVVAQSELDSREKLFEELLQQKENEFNTANEQIARLEEENKRLSREANSIREVLNQLQQRAIAPPIILAAPATPDITPRVKPARPDTPADSTNLAAATPVVPPEAENLAALAVYRDLPPTFTAAKGKLPFPVSGTLVGKYGAKTLDGSTLDGLQIETRSGAIVTAPYNGEVVFAENLGRLGNVFILDVGENYHLVMAGFARLDARVGQRIEAGEPVGKMPDGGTREELYFEIRRNREPLNPSKWLRAQASG